LLIDISAKTKKKVRYPTGRAEGELCIRATFKL
jgi:hypothetical protein